ncbi:response regulator transcription factor [Paenibacillus hexagrammi]|uniref:Response regulator transcription factor n=1 Tax=Paenibacillus hexagrammi TaxID=2908839 RepID=A0ABY3SME6_9BACL|nr:response regulator transcription factor [Paenibacillus sp. YPD9-1]UJF35227.1 response regulator transcription factor [Paenibacillus sp. YPD9-1]
MIKVMITDDDPFIRESLKLIIGLDPEMQITGTYSSGQEVLEALQTGVEADIILMDIRMPVCDGVQGTHLIKLSFPHVRVLILTTFDDDEFIVQALRNGASGYLLKNIPPDRIIQGIKSVHQGHVLIDSDIAKKLTSLLTTVTPSEPATPHFLTERGLTPTEQNVVIKISEGLTNKEIAQELFLSEGTVKNYITEILSKLCLRDRTQIAIYYLKRLHSS